MLAYVLAPGPCIVARLLSLLPDTSHDLGNRLSCGIVRFIEVSKPLGEEHLIAMVDSFASCQKSGPEEACTVLKTNIRASHGRLQTSTDAGYLVLQNDRINIVHTAVEVYA